MIIHLHATCWNEERMLPFFFRHYDRFVDHYFIHDNQSSDGSIDILKSHPRVTILPFMIEGESIVELAISKINEFWKISRGQADWIAVCNIDELFWHVDINWYLRECRKKNITFLGSKGYQMVSRKFADPDDDLIQTHRCGCRFRKFDKPSFFNPDAIAETRFARGRHSCNPTGHVVRAKRDEILLLHYKYIGEGYVEARHAELNARRRPLDVQRRYGWQYDPAETKTLFADFIARSREVVPANQVLRANVRRMLGPRVRPKFGSSVIQSAIRQRLSLIRKISSGFNLR